MLDAPLPVIHALLAVLTGAVLFREIELNLDLRGLFERWVEGAWAT